MACYAALASLVQLLEEIRIPDEHRFPDFHRDQKQITYLLKMLKILQELLEEDYSSIGDNLLERRIRDVAYRAQDIVETRISDLICLEDEMTTNQLSSHSRARFQDVGMEYRGLGRLLEEVDCIVEEAKRIKETSRTEHVHLSDRYCSADISASKSTMVGCDELLTTLKSELCLESSSLKVISIVGMGGIGKTALARNVFDDRYIVHHFYIRAWVTVSQDYRLQKVLQTIYESINPMAEGLDKMDEDKLRESVYKSLKGRRYLVVMDDVWNTEAFDDVKRILPDDINGSRILLTTRLSDVAADTSSSLHAMDFLNEEQSWNLLQERVFSGEQCPHTLDDIGKLIASNCHGLPLAIIVAAGLLSNVNRERYDWEQIAGNINSAIVENDEHFSKILSLSYNHLPHHLKACFLYIGGFPQGELLSVSKLIQLWIAEGIVEQKESKTFEEVAKEYLEDLVKRNLVLMTRTRYSGRLKYSGIHDLLRDLCRQIVRDEDFFHFTNESQYLHREGAEKMRRACLLGIHTSTSPASGFVTRQHGIGAHVRSIFCFHYSLHPQGLPAFELLRVLDALDVRFCSFPLVIVQLFHLRYLAFRQSLELREIDNTVSKSGIYELRIPPQISKLQNLQTLVVAGRIMPGGRVSVHVSLPYEFWKMPQLRHVMVGPIMNLAPPIPFDGRIVGADALLENLQTLLNLRNFSFTSKAVEMMPNLKELEVFFDGATSPTMWQDYCLINIVSLNLLEKLKLFFYGRLAGAGVEPFPQSFAFPQSIKTLTLGQCRLPWDDMTAVGSLPNLQVLELLRDAFVGEEWETIEGEFPRLKFLVLFRLNLKHWQVESCNFMSLEHLRIYNCPELEEIPLEMSNIPTLEMIEIFRCQLAEASALLIEEEQRDNGNDTFQLRIYSEQEDLS